MSAAWKWWTSNSWKRLKTADREMRDVLYPYIAPDGHPDLCVSKGTMSLIAAAPNLMCAAKAAHATMLDLLNGSALTYECDRASVEEAAAKLEDAISAAMVAP